MKQIPLTKNKIALVDDEDFEYLMRWKWCISGRYAIRGVYIGKLDGKNKFKHILMHRVINKTPDDLYTDHINGDGLDNRKRNLRTCTIGQNNINKLTKTIYTSKYRGVSWDKRKKKWRACLQLNRKHIFLGYFKCQIKAAKAYNNAAIEFHGEFCRLNVIQ